MLQRTDPEFSTPAGTYAGARRGDVVRVGGIVYARAQRFRPPVPVAGAVQDPRPAVACVQRVDATAQLFGRPYEGVEFDEDCHRLSVTLPAGAAAGDGLPVMVWIHGGAYVTGGGDLPIYDPALLVAEHRVVVVNVTYRLGVLGYLGAAGGRPANLGLLDQLAALRWVRENVAAFGGDPDAVTVFGESAGGDAVAHLLASDGSEGLFRRAVVQSAPLGIRRNRRRMGAALDRAAGDLAADATAEELLAAEPLVLAAARRFGLRGGMPFATRYGQVPLPAEREVEARWRRVAPQVDVLVGTTAQEASLFLDAVPALRAPGAARSLRRAATAVGTHLVFRRGARQFAQLLAGAGGRVEGYELRWAPRGSELGATHGIELPLLFENPAGWRGATVLGEASDEEVARAGRVLRQVWARFARTGEAGPSPDPEVLRVWPVSAPRRAGRRS
ncbi:carboxylesterase family protein [Kineococcus glutinatus]|uniref:Carboxylic ester hydrolase n=1 Tax=Kineococcus glutinatus TaxID=1070872 RepID=A0ABP9IAS2_9ACTN